jgi:hypothetical protein
MSLRGISSDGHGISRVELLGRSQKFDPLLLRRCLFMIGVKTLYMMLGVFKCDMGPSSGLLA